MPPLPPVHYVAHVRLTPALHDGRACDVIGQKVADGLDGTLLGASQDDDAHRMSWTLKGPRLGDPGQAVAALVAAIRGAVPAGHLLEHDSITVLSEADVARRLAGEGVPPPGLPLSTGRPRIGAPGLVSTAEFAELCGLTPARIRQLRADQRRAKAAGEPHSFPPEYMPGYWVAEEARVYAALPRPPAGRPPSSGTH